MLQEEMLTKLVIEIKRFLLADAVLLSRASDEQLLARIREIVDYKIGNARLAPQDKGTWYTR